MNKILMILIFVFGVSCSSNIQSISGYKNISVLDFRKYNESNFLFTTEPYTGDYESLGIIDVVYRVKAKKVNREYFSNDGIIDNIPSWDIEQLSQFQEEILDMVYNSATELGGNCIMNLRITSFDKTYDIGLEYITVPGVKITGFVIKRK